MARSRQDLTERAALCRYVRMMLVDPDAWPGFTVPTPTAEQIAAGRQRNLAKAVRRVARRTGRQQTPGSRQPPPGPAGA